MKAYQTFDKLPLEKQLQRVNEQGIFLCERYFLSRRVSLFYINSFFVEIWFDTQKNLITTILPFTTTLCLTPYLDLVNIDDVFDYSK